MKRFASSFLFAAILLSAVCSSVFGQTWDRVMETHKKTSIIGSFGSDIGIITYTAEVMAIIPKMPKEQQFSVGSDEITQGMEGILSNNSDALIHLAKKSDRLVVYGLQDETGNYIDGLGECRARNVAKELNKLMWNEEISLKITSQEYPLKNFVKSGILREHQQLLNQRGVAIVAHFDQNTQTDTSGIWFLPPSLRPLPWQL